MDSIHYVIEEKVYKKIAFHSSKFMANNVSGKWMFSLC